jgi:hypothetical protein
MSWWRVFARGVRAILPVERAVVLALVACMISVSLALNGLKHEARRNHIGFKAPTESVFLMRVLQFVVVPVISEDKSNRRLLLNRNGIEDRNTGGYFADVSWREGRGRHSMRGLSPYVFPIFLNRIHLRFWKMHVFKTLQVGIFSGLKLVNLYVSEFCKHCKRIEIRRKRIGPAIEKVCANVSRFCLSGIYKRESRCSIFDRSRRIAYFRDRRQLRQGGGLLSSISGSCGSVGCALVGDGLDVSRIRVADEYKEREELDAESYPFTVWAVIVSGAVIGFVGWCLIRKGRGWACVIGLGLFVGGLLIFWHGLKLKDAIDAGAPSSAVSFERDAGGSLGDTRRTVGNRNA